MDKPAPKKIARNIERVFLLLNTIVLGALFFILYSVLQHDFTDVRRRLSDGTMVNLNEKSAGENFGNLLRKGYYFEDERDVALMQNVVSSGLSTNQGNIDNIGEVNKRSYFVLADEAYAKGGESFKKRVISSRSLLGFTGNDSARFVQEIKSPPSVPSSTNVGMGKYSISGNIVTKEDKPVSGVLVRLQMILPQDSAYSETVTEVAKNAIENGPGFQRIYLLDSVGASSIAISYSLRPHGCAG